MNAFIHDRMKELMILAWPIVRKAVRNVGSRADWDDLEGVCVDKLPGILSLYSEWQGKFSAFVFRCLVNALRSHQRHQQSQNRRYKSWWLDSSRDQNADCVLAEQPWDALGGSDRERCERLLSILEPRCAQAIRLAYLCRKSHGKQMAAVHGSMGITRSTHYRLVRDGLEAIRLYLCHQERYGRICSEKIKPNIRRLLIHHQSQERRIS